MKMSSPYHYNYDSDFENEDLLKTNIKSVSELEYNQQLLLNIRSRSHQNEEGLEEDVILKRRIGTGVAFVSLIAENLISHPFQVLRRQCQVNYSSKWYHLVPITLIPTVYRLHQHQGLTTLWKGLGSVLLIRGFSLGVEDLISKCTPLPKEVHWHSPLKEFFKHTILKCLTFAIVTPFYSASFVETVQSEIASERPGFLDVFKEGFLRLLNWNGGIKGRMLPIWVLIVPTVTLGLAKYLFSLFVKGATFRILESKYIHRYRMNGAMPKDWMQTIMIQDLSLAASLLTSISTDVVFYPCETIIHRLYLQGTRTIVDNLDTGQSVLPILTNFAGAIDCYESCIASEGRLGLYKGFGALMAQYMVHCMLLTVTRFLLTELGNLLCQKKKKPPLHSESASPVLVSNVQNSPRTYLLP